MLYTAFFAYSAKNPDTELTPQQNMKKNRIT